MGAWICGPNGASAVELQGEPDASVLSAYADAVRSRGVTIQVPPPDGWHYELVFEDPDFLPRPVVLEVSFPLAGLEAMFPDYVTERSRTSIELRVNTGGDGFQALFLNLDLYKSILDVLAYVALARDGIRVALQHALHVPVEAVTRWQNTGEVDGELGAYVRRYPDWSPANLAEVLGVPAADCRDLLTQLGYRQITDAGTWFRPPTASEMPPED